MKSKPKLYSSVAMIATVVTGANAVGGNPNVRFQPSATGFPLATLTGAASVQTDETDWPGVKRAAEDFRNDLFSVSGKHSGSGSSALVVLVGTIGKSPTIDRLIRERKLDVSGVRGKWEASVTRVVEKPLPGIKRALVIAGSDKRGTIYALYDLSESIGVSPWNWWADVPVKKHSELYVLPKAYVAKSPGVKYRGIFLNDEAPALSNWVRQNYGDYNHRFYEKVFELLLRLRANYLWPAMWNNCFSQDDPLNPVKADEYGIVMGTSHVEPMMRADKEWNRLKFTERQWNYATNPTELEQFWKDGIVRNKPYENIVTIAMRGKIDTPMSESANINVLERIVASQRKLIAENVNPDVTKVPQLWCLYKEVQEYYEKGMRVPDDVTLLWADDNWGDIRRLPTAEERNRAGGAGVYYHFDYVGGPRNYKWLDTNPIPKIWEQMNLAKAYGADRIWIVNVGDLKPMEFPLDFFMTMARDPEAMKAGKMAGFARSWAAREFGPEHATEIADIVTETHRLAGQRKPELIEPGTFSLIHYNEAEAILNRFHRLVRRAEALQSRMSPAYGSAYFQLVLHPIKANSILNELYIVAAKNALYAKQGRASSNELAKRVRELFAADSALTKQYHELNGGKWNHFMDQTHIGYTTWQEPPKNNIPRTAEIEIPESSKLGVAVEGSESSWPGTDRPQLAFTRYGSTTRWIDLFNRGKVEFGFTVTSDVKWIKFSSHTGKVGQDTRIQLSIDWSQLRDPHQTGHVAIAGANEKVVVDVHVDATKTTHSGFVESDGVIAIDPTQASIVPGAKQVTWQTIPGYGRYGSGITPSPVTMTTQAIGKGPRLDYDLVVTSSGPARVDIVGSPSLGFAPGHGLRVAVSIDNLSPEVIDLAPKYLSRQWEAAVRDTATTASFKQTLSAGPHRLTIWAIDPGVVLQRIFVDLGNMKPSYLGPPLSQYVKPSSSEVHHGR